MSIEDHGRALEDAFFVQKDRELLNRIKSELDLTARRDELKQATGITDDSVLDELIGIGVSAESLAAVALVPLVLVAWADGSINDKEREAVLTGAEQAGIKKDNAAGKLLSGWLTEKPAANLTEAWKDYAKAIGSKLPAGDKVKLGEQLLARCSKVAEAAGGFLGLGSVSDNEKAVLDMLKETLE